MNFITREMILPFVDNVVYSTLNDVDLFENLEQALADTIKYEANIEPFDDVNDTPSWMLKPCAAIMSKLCLPKIEIRTQFYVDRIESEYQEALKVLRNHRVEEVNSVTPPAYGAMEGGISW